MGLITNTQGYVAAGVTKTILSSPGSIIALLISHNQATAQTVTLYDNITTSGTVLAKIHVAPEQSPTWIPFPDKYPLRFSNGLAIDPGPNCDVLVLAGTR